MCFKTCQLCLKLSRLSFHLCQMYQFKAVKMHHIPTQTSHNISIKLNNNKNSYLKILISQRIRPEQNNHGNGVSRELLKIMGHNKLLYLDILPDDFFSKRAQFTVVVWKELCIIGSN
ncbi:uncharacterized protein A4U43_C02F20200 [Asparagus officinalis]|uniref:Uncharacterized protein n=1 Tax=Asparagus officinalis TaxID=4686 RepID=A0A5P1FNM8_ASPOF|nr:uncharacterized protein A4U43_C02F20200 [Asparagus officinalis]